MLKLKKKNNIFSNMKHSYWDGYLSNFGEKDRKKGGMRRKRNINIYNNIYNINL
jgi:hypothetical protein